MSIFRAYDIRGIYGEELTDEIAYKIGRAFVTFLACKEVIIGHDMRDSHKTLMPALIRGITQQGANVIKIGLCTTPLFYFACRNSPAGIMITASHNPAEYNGFKLCRENVVSLSGETGIQEIKKLVEKNKFKTPKQKGKETTKNVLNDFVDFNVAFGKNIAKYKIVFDAGNGMSSYADLPVYKKLGLKVIPLFMKLDGNFPHRKPDPLKAENRIFAEQAVKKNKADLGIITDGDGDRVIFVDETGTSISADLIIALLAEHFLKKHKHAMILYDLRSSKIVKEIIEKHNGKAIESRVGHAYIKKLMRQLECERFIIDNRYHCLIR